jgi:malonyl-CoA O-methyltransferase
MYKNVDELKPMFSDFEVRILKEEIVEIEFSSPVDVLRHIKGIGANAMAAEFWTKGVLKDFERQYREYFSTQNGVSLTYHPIYAVVRKKEK